MTHEEIKDKEEALRKAAEPLIKLLAQKFHPHCTAIVTSNKVEILEGVIGCQVDEFLVD